MEKPTIRTRINFETKKELEQLLKLLKEKSGLSISESSFLQMALKFFIADVKKNGLTLEFK
jgi:hypothetical protein